MIMPSKKNKSSILIVDDNAQNIQVLGTILKNENYDVTVAMEGLEALEYLIKEKPDLILLDVMMPKMNGYEVCRIIKKDKKLKKIPVIFITAKTGSEDVVKGFSVGAVDYISKPFNADELLARVETHLELSRSREQIKTLEEMIPICSNCKKVRDDDGYWKKVEQYISEKTNSTFSHGICDECAKKLYPELNEIRENVDDK